MCSDTTSWVWDFDKPFIMTSMSSHHINLSYILYSERNHGSGGNSVWNWIYYTYEQRNW